MPTKVISVILVVLAGLVAAIATLPLIAQAAWAVSSSSDRPVLQPTVGYATQFDVSPDLITLAANATTPSVTPSHNLLKRPLPLAQKSNLSSNLVNDPVLQVQVGDSSMPAPLTNFEGVSNRNKLYPPDTEGDIGFDPSTGQKYYLQWVNTSFAIWDVTDITPTIALTYTNGNALWQGLGGPCEAQNNGDPIALYDSLAHRWLMSQMALPNGGTGPYYQCVAISQTGNPLGQWYRYAFHVHDTNMNDYAKWGVWPDGYYMSVNQFYQGGDTYTGVGAFVFHRDKMLVGDPSANFVYFDLGAVDLYYFGMLPSDLDGPPPPVGSPNYFVEADHPAVNDVLTTSLRLWAFHADWATPVNSTFGISGTPNLTLTVAPFNLLPCVPNQTLCIPQPGTSQLLDGLADRLMYRLQYRNYGDHETLVVNHTVLADGADRAGIRWYELTKTLTTDWSIEQQGTYAPADGNYRWMGSLAADGQGNLALGFSVASASLYPSIRYVGRLVTDTLNALPQAETELYAGSGSQTGADGRWGDYSTMSIDPVDDCTFWYTQEYLPVTSATGWHTRIGSFKFSACIPLGELTGLVADDVTARPIANAQIVATAGPTYTLDGSSGASGTYFLPLVTGTYTVTAAAFGYRPITISDVMISASLVTTQNITLTAAPMHVISGTVTDANDGWPLSAHIAISGEPFNPPAPNNGVWTDPVTGFYRVTLPEAITYTFNITAPGYLAGSQIITVTDDITRDFALNVDLAACIAARYHLINGACVLLPHNLYLPLVLKN